MKERSTDTCNLEAGPAAAVAGLSLESFDYDLPEDLIAKYPLERRDESRLLVARRSGGEIIDSVFNRIGESLPADAFIVLNSTKVIAARIPALKPTGGRAEILCVAPVEPSRDPQVAMKARGAARWECILGGRAIREGMTLIAEANADFKATVIIKRDAESVIEFHWDEGRTFAEELESLGKIPLPPYIKREVEESDKERYQTVYARLEGSVAAPTAGLHFTKELIEKLEREGHSFGEVALHVGPGTFQPVGEGGIAKHAMHCEQFFVRLDFLKELRDSISQGKPVIAAGTTSVRTLESLPLLAENILSFGEAKPVEQWQAYAEGERLGAGSALGILIDYCERNSIDSLEAETSLLILPGFKFKIISGMITNFHLPKSTLLLLVSAFLGGERWRELYAHAIEARYRFLSFGDASALL